MSSLITSRVPTIKFRTFLLLFSLVAVMFAYIPSVALADDYIEVPVKFTVKPDAQPIRLGEEITIEAVTKKEGNTFEVHATWSGGTSHNELITETTLEGDHYVSRGTVHADVIGILTINYKITMRGEGKEWVGKASATIDVKDNMPPAIPSVEGKISMYPSDKIEIGKPVQFKAYVPNKGNFSQARFRFGYPNHHEIVENVKTVRSGSKYVTTGSFTPKKAGKYTVYYSIIMKDEEGNPIEGSAVIKFTVHDNGKIYASLSPNTATMNVGEEIYLLLTYTMDENMTVQWNYPAESTVVDHDPETGLHKELLKFKPEKTGTYNFEVTITQDVNGSKKTGKAKTKIYVR